MEPTEVQSTDDILAAADSRLNAPIEPITKKVVPEARAQDPEPEAALIDSDSDEDPNAGGDPEPEAGVEVDGERLTASEVRQLKRDAARVKEADEARQAAQYLLQHPEEYERVRREHGLAPATPPKPEPKPEDHGPDPVDDARGWKYERFNQYVNYLASRGETATTQAIMQQVERDHDTAQTKRLHEILLEERAERQEDAKRREQEQAQWRQNQEAATIARTLTPLFQKYPQAATADGQEEVEARIIRAVHLGQPVNYEQIVKTVHERNRGVIKNWADNKKVMAGGAGPAVARGGSAQGSRTKLRDKLPADISSIALYAEMAERGET